MNIKKISAEIRKIKSKIRTLESKLSKIKATRKELLLRLNRIKKHLDENPYVEDIKTLNKISKQLKNKLTKNSNYITKYNEGINLLKNKLKEQEELKDIEILKHKEILKEKRKVKQREYYLRKKQKLFEEKCLTMLRENRKVYENNAVVIQKPIIDTSGKTYEDLNTNIYVRYFHDNLRDMIKSAHDALYKDNDNVVTGNIMVFYAVKDGDKLEFRYTKPIVFTKDTDPLNTNSLTLTVENQASGITPIFLGYKIITKLSNGVRFNKENIYKLKAFHPVNNRKYHELTTASTSTNKMCIYETFLDIMNIKALSYSRDKNNKKFMLELLKKEGDDIYNAILNGELVKSLELLTTKYESEILIVFFGYEYKKENKELNDDEKPILINNGKTSRLNVIGSDRLGKKAMLYMKDKHVAPFIYKHMTVNDEKKFDREKKFMLEPQNLTNIKYNIVGVLGYDLETYNDDDNMATPYAAGVYGHIGNTVVKLYFYGWDCVKQLVKYFKKISTPLNYKKTKSNKKIPNIHVYGFNNSNFDNLLIYRDVYKIDSNIKSIIAGNSIKEIRYNNIRILDLRCYYVGSLDTLADDFKLEISKGVFPYDFVTKNNLDYIGSVPDVKYWKSQADYDEYVKKNGLTFNMKEYTLEYLALDCELTYKIACKHLDSCCGELNSKNFDVRSCPTSANMSVKLFKQCFLNQKLYGSPENIVKKEKEAYKGGRTEKFINYFESVDGSCLRGYDINSSYPSSMVGEMPIKYSNCIIYNDEELRLNDIVNTNLYYAKSEYIGNDPNFIPNLLVRENKSVVAFKNTNYAYHWGCELREAILNKCKITIREELIYETSQIFDDFVEHFYNERQRIKNTHPALQLFYKNILNSLYGKFGQKEFNTTAVCTSTDEIYRLLNNDASLLVGMDFIINDGEEPFFLIEYKRLYQEERIGKLIRLSSYIGAKSRCILSDAMRALGHEKVYYCDTDSIYTTNNLPDDMVSDTVLGKWKLEHGEISKAVFLAPKSYMIVEGSTVDKKAKGLKGESLTVNDYIDAYCNNDPIKQTRKFFFRSVTCGIRIEDQKRTMVMVDNKRIWSENCSSPYDGVEQWKNIR